MWQDHILQLPKSGEYFEAVRRASAEVILRNITDQVFELAHISKEKMDTLGSGRVALWFGFWSWLMMLMIGFMLVRFT